MRPSRNKPLSPKRTPKTRETTTRAKGTANPVKGRSSGPGKAQTDEVGGDFVRQGHVSGRQFMFLLAYLMGTKVLYLFPTGMSTKSGSAAWISVLLSTTVALLGLWGWLLWVDLTGEEGFVPSLRKTCGGLIGDATAALICVSVTVATGWSIRLFVGGAVIGVVPQFPIEALVWTSVLAGIYAAWLGIDAVGRAAGFFFLPTLLSFAVAMLSVLRDFDLRNLAPFWGLGAGNTAVQGLATLGTYGGLVAVGIMKSYVRKRQELAPRSVAGLLISAAVLIAGVVFAAGVFPYPMSAGKADPLGAMVRSVNLGRLLQRVEVLFIFVWFFSTSVQVSFLYVLDLALLSQLARTGTYRPFAPALAVLTFGIAAIPANTLRVGQLMDMYVLTTSGSALVFLGWALYLVGRARGFRPQKDSAGGDTTANDPDSTA